MKVQGIVPLFYLHHPAFRRARPAPLNSAKEHSQHQGRAFPQTAFGFFCSLSFVKLAFFSLAEYLAVGIYLFPSLIFFFF